MSETRPVPRRESPWVVTGDNHREPKAHRCNGRVEDVIQREAIGAIYLSGFGTFRREVKPMKPE